MQELPGLSQSVTEGQNDEVQKLLELLFATKKSGIFWREF